MQIEFSNRTKDLHGSAIREAFKALSKPGMISFAGGSPAPETFPKDEFGRLAGKILTTSGNTALQYGITEGYAPLIEQVRADLKGKNMDVDNNSVIIVSGGQQGIELAAKVLLNEGDGVACEDPSFVGALNAFRSYKATLYGVEIEEDGMNLERLEETLAQHREIKLIYTIPTFQNPTGITMSVEKRKKLLELAKKYQVWIIEDNPYGELSFDGTPVPTIKSFDTEGQVLYVGSFSKILSPGLRTGFVCGTPELVEKMVVCKQVSDVHTNVLAQMVISKFLETYDIQAQIERCRTLYAKKCKWMQDCMERYFPKNMTWTKPRGGIFIWCDANNGKDSKALNAMAIERNVAIVPGSSAMPDDKKVTSAFRLNYSCASDQQIETGIQALAEALEQF